MSKTAKEVASLFESLGGGSLNQNGWAFGCEFGFWQRDVGLEPLGLLRWASIAPKDLLLGLTAKFAGVGDESALELREHTDFDWGATQRTYGIYLDHSHLDRREVSKDHARRQIANSLGFLRNKLIADLESNQKLFVYRTYDHTLTIEEQENLALAVGRYGSSTLCYVQHSTSAHPAFTAERKMKNLIVGYIDRFAPQNQGLVYNSRGWELVCRAMLDVWK